MALDPAARALARRLTLSPLLMLAALLFTYVPQTQGLVFHTGLAALALMGAYVFGVRPLMPDPAGTALRRGLGFLGTHSLEIFLLHQPLIREYNVYLHGRWLNDPAPSRFSLFVGMLIGFAVTLVLSVELHRLLGRFLSGRKPGAAPAPPSDRP